MKNWLLIASACVVTITAAKGHASARPVQEISGAAASLKFEMPGVQPTRIDGAGMMAMAIGIGVAPMFNVVQNGLTPDRGSCPPAPLAQCTTWLEAKSAMVRMFIAYVGMIAAPSVSCIELGNFASKVYIAKNAQLALGDILSAIGSSSGNANKATLLQGVAIAIYADGSLNRERAFKSADAACQTLPQPRSQ